MGRGRDIQRPVDGSFPVVPVLDRFAKHGLAGLVIAALFFLVWTNNRDSMATIREVTVIAYELRNAVEKQTVVLGVLADRLGVSKDSLNGVGSHRVINQDKVAVEKNTPQLQLWVKQDEEPTEWKQ